MKWGKDARVALALGLLGLLALWLNRGEPLVRNGLVYARVAERVVEHGYDPRPIVADSALSYDKPIAFAWLGAPLVSAWGTHVGLMLLSAASTLLYLGMVWRFLVALSPGAENERLRARALLFAALGPLTVYQFWSAHPDALFAALTLAALTQMLELARAPERAPVRRVLLLALTIECSALLKNYGLILLAALPLAYGTRLWRARARSRRARVALACAWLALGGSVLLAYLELHPVHRLVGEGGGFAQYGSGELGASARGVLLQCGLALLVQLQLVLPAAFAARLRQHEGWPLLVFAAVYVGGLLPFPNGYYNMRYFLPLFPLVGWMAALGLERAGEGLARGATAAFAALGLASAAAFNVEALFTRLAPALPAWKIRGERMPGLLDNLRMGLHLEQRAWLEHVNANLEPGAEVLMLGFRYYGDAQQGVYERAGLIRADVLTHYVEPEALAPSAGPFYVCFGGRPDARLLEGFGRVTDLGQGLFRVDPAAGG